MELYNTPQGHEDAYVIQNPELNPQLAGPYIEQFEAMYNEGAHEFVVDQGLYYPTATNYGYICTGFESPSSWEDHQRIFGLDGQNTEYAGAQTESLPYVYYTPNYGYAQSPYNPYNPYIPGAIIGVDSPFVGAQQYYTTPPYENTVSSSSYYPLVLQSRPDVISGSAADLFVETTAFTSNRAGGPGIKQKLSSASATYNPAAQRSSSNQTNSFSRSSESIKVNAGPSKQSAMFGSVSSGSLSNPSSSQVLQGRGSQNLDNSLQAKAGSNFNQPKIAVSSSNGLSNFGSNSNGWPLVDKGRSKLHFGRVSNDVSTSPDVLSEQNRGPRTYKSKNHISVKAYTTKAGDTDAQGNIIIYTDQYNRDDFPVDYINAKFFVIKSYSEDDVHKSIKYNVWSSTPNGNKKLNNAYEDAQRLAAGESRSYPIFLFFSVNASGQFCGVAEMTGPVDFHRDMDFWQQDKWSGSFPLKWHIIKDVPNPNFRHIILENNENKPVTNSRDTQEIKYKKGMDMLKIFKNYASKTSLLDDFLYYENRQKILHEEKAKLLMKNYKGPFFTPILDTPYELKSGLVLPSTGDVKTTKNDELKSCEKNETATLMQISSERNTGNLNVNENGVCISGETDDTTVFKFGELGIKPKQTAAEPLDNSTVSDDVAHNEPLDVVTVGSMPVKVNGYAESSGFLTVGSIPLDPRALRPDESSIFTKIGSQK